MDEREKAELNKQKKIVDCIEHLNTALDSLDRLDEYKSRVIPIVDGLDMTHSDTYFEVTNKLKQELFYIKAFTAYAAEDLVRYRRLLNPDRQIYSVKEKKRKALYGIEPISDWEKRHQENKRALDRNQKEIDKLLQQIKQKESEPTKTKSVEEVEQELDRAIDKKKEWHIRRANRITKIEQDVLKLKWAMFLLFVLQTAILLKLCF